MDYSRSLIGVKVDWDPIGLEKALYIVFLCANHKLLARISRELFDATS